MLDEKEIIETLENLAVNKYIDEIKLEEKDVEAIINIIILYRQEKEKNKSLIKERATEIVYVDRNFIRKDRLKPIQIIDLDGKIHNVYKIEEE